MTPRATRTFAYLRKTHEVSPLIDNRSNEIADIYWVMGESVARMAEEFTGEERGAMLVLNLAKRPYLEEFVRSQDNALVRVKGASSPRSRGQA